MLRKSLDLLYLLSGWAAGVFLIMILVLMMGMSLGRQFGFNIPAGDDFASWCMAAMAFLGLAHTFKAGDMIRVGLLLERLPERARFPFEVFSLVLGTLFCVYFAWNACSMVVDSWDINDVSAGAVPVPMWIPQLGYAGGLVILAIAMIDEFVRVAILRLPPGYEKPAPQTAEEVVERALESAV